jgi:putative transposase
MRKIDYYMHCASKKVVQYCLDNNVGTIVIGKNSNWKNEVNIGHKNNQTFVSIPYRKFMLKLKYKAQNAGISVLETEERYTSGTSFIDNELPIKENYNKKRRVKRGLFASNDGIKINADLNGAYQIIKKVFPNAFEQGNRGCAYHPVRINI